ncbi:hypothetical protein ACFLZY_01640 [Patescibacteria group bacterium]
MFDKTSIRSSLALYLDYIRIQDSRPDPNFANSESTESGAKKEEARIKKLSKNEKEKYISF